MRLRTAAVLALLAGILLSFWSSAAHATSSEPSSEQLTRSSGTPVAFDNGDGQGDNKGPVTTITGTLRNSAENNAPVEGVTIRVTTTDGEELEDVTDENGQYAIEAPATGKTTVELVTDSLPDDVKVREDIQNPLTVTLSPGRSELTTVFAIGPDTRNVQQWYERIPQTVWDGAVFGVFLALGALGLSMIFGTTGLTNFAHGELVTFGAIMTYVFNVAAGLPIWLAAVIALVLSAIFGFAQDKWFWRPLRRRGTGLIALMIVSIGLQFFLRNLYQYGTGGQTLNYDAYTTPESNRFLGVDYSVRDLVLVLVALVLLGAVTLGLQKTRIGRATRAVADNPALAASSGINVDRVITWVWTVGMTLAGACGVLLGFTQSVKFDMGAQILLVMFAAITVGGLGSIWGAMIGSVIVGILIESSTLIIPAELKIATALFALVVVLLVRPQGLLGLKERVG